MDRDFLSLRIPQSHNEERNGSLWSFPENQSAMPFSVGKEDCTKVTHPELHVTERTFAEVQCKKAAGFFRQSGSHLSLSQCSITPETQHSAVSPLLSATNQGVLARSSSNGSQLTIFLAGKVVVFDEVSAGMAQRIMLMAEEHSKMHQIQSAVNLNAVNVPSLSPVSATFSNSMFATGEDSNQTKTSAIMLSLPQARKASLARFLEKRKERVANVAPYSLSKMI